MFHGGAKIVPMRAAPAFGIEERDPDPRGMALMGADRRQAGTITDVWIDKSEIIIRYLEAQLTGADGAPGRRVLVPMTFAKVNRRRGTVEVSALMSGHFQNVPAIANPDQVTLLEEDKICAYYGAGTLYATPARAEPLL